MPTQKSYDQYDKRLIALLDSALQAPVVIERKFRTRGAAYEFRHILYQLRFAARAENVKSEWDVLKFSITRTYDVVIARKGNSQLETILSDI